MLVAKLKYEDSHKGGEYLKGHVIERGAVKANRLMLVNSWSAIKDGGERRRTLRLQQCRRRNDCTIIKGDNEANSTAPKSLFQWVRRRRPIC